MNKEEFMKTFNRNDKVCADGMQIDYIKIEKFRDVDFVGYNEKKELCKTPYNYANWKLYE